MADISKIEIENTSYDIKDVTARSSISTLTSTVNTLATKILNKKYIFIGDSYNTSDTPVGYSQITPWGPLVATYLGLTNNDYYNSGVSGAGWHVSGNKFITQLQTLAASISDKNSITDIYVLGGINDNQLEPDDVYNEILDFADYALTTFPNAMVSIGVISWPTYTASKINLLKKMNVYFSAINRPNVKFISTAYTWYHNYSDYQGDGHPNSDGSRLIALNIANYIKGGVALNKIYYEGSIYRDNNNIGISSSQATIGTMKQFLNGENVCLQINLDMINLTSSTIAPSITTPYILGSVDNLFIRTLNDPLCIYTGYVWGYDTTTTSYINMAYNLFIQEGQLKISFYYVDKTAGNVQFNFSILVFDKIPIITIPTALC